MPKRCGSTSFGRAGLGLTCLILSVWLASGVIAFGWQGRRVGYNCILGRFICYWVSEDAGGCANLVPIQNYPTGFWSSNLIFFSPSVRSRVGIQVSQSISQSTSVRNRLFLAWPKQWIWQSRLTTSATPVTAQLFSKHLPRAQPLSPIQDGLIKFADGEVCIVGTQTMLICPLWLPLLLVGTCTVLILRGARRRSCLPSCGSCSYLLIGNTTGICPECGTPIPKDVIKELVDNDNSDNRDSHHLFHSETGDCPYYPGSG